METGVLRAVLDTNVLVSALHFPESQLAELWQSLAERQYDLVLSPSIVAETAGVLRRRFLWRETEITRTLKLLVKRAQVVRAEGVLDAVPDDPKDNHILACALAGKVDVIVSGDKDLLRLREFEGIPIVRPMDFLRTIRRR